MADMKIQTTGSKVFRTYCNNAICSILLFILALTVAPKAKADDPSDSLNTLPIRTLSDITVSQENGQLTVTMKMNRLHEPTVFKVENPSRLVFDFPDTVNMIPFKKLLLNDASVRQVRVGQFQNADPKIARVVFDLNEGFRTHEIRLDKSSVQVTFLPVKTFADNAISISRMKSESNARMAVNSVSKQENGILAKSPFPTETRDSGESDSSFPEGRISSAQKSTSVARRSLPVKSVVEDGGVPSAPADSLPVESAETAARNPVQTKTSTPQSLSAEPGTVSAETAPSSEKQDSVKPSSRLSQKSESTIEIPKSAENHASSPEAKLPAGIQAEGVPAAYIKRASLAEPRGVQAPDARPPTVASRTSIGPSYSSLEATLDQVGESVEQFRRQFDSVACTEFVSQTKLGKGDAVIYKKEYEYDYMIFMNIRRDGMRVEESRQEKRTKGKTKDLPLLVTQGFPTLLLIFHPFYQGSFEYQYDGEEMVEGRNLMKIAFRHIRGRRSTSVLHLKGKNYPLELKGIAWIDPESNNINRIRAELIGPLEVVGLQAFNSDVRYIPMQFESKSPTFWMPETATVEVMTRKQRWRNVHRFEDYRLFSVSSESEIDLP